MGKRGPHINELFDLTGKVAMVTGGAQNLGLDMAEALGEAGADLVITSRDPEKVERAVAMSAEKYCSASVMLAKTAEITHEIEVREAAG